MTTMQPLIHSGLLASLTFICTAAACTIAPTTQHPTVASAPASRDASDAARHDAVRQLAATDLACPGAAVVLTFSREFANTAQPSHVVDGCGKRAVYAEDCSDHPHCRYILISLLALVPPPARDVALPPGATLR